MDEEEIKMGDVSILHSLRRELTHLLTCGRLSLVSGTQNNTVVSGITLRGIYCILTLASILDHAFCCGSAASSGRRLHLIISLLRTKHIRRTVRTMFSELKGQLTNELQFIELSEVCSANKQ